MLEIKYKIIKEFVEDIESISDEEINYSFLLGSASFVSYDKVIEMKWEWIPLLDMAYCLKVIARNINANCKSKESFEFTENAEVLQFSKDGLQLNISASFSSVLIETTIKEFEVAVYNFHISISKYVRENFLLKEFPENLQKYLII